jgi:hypothetical protein
MTTVSYSIVNTVPEFDGSINSSIFLGSENSPALTTLGDGSFVLTYGYTPADTEAIPSKVFVNHLTATGSETSGFGFYGASDMDTSPNSSALYPSITALPGSGNFLAIWAAQGGLKFGFSKPLGTMAGVGYDQVFSAEGLLPGPGFSDLFSSVGVLPGNKFAVAVEDVGGSGFSNLRVYSYDDAHNVSLLWKAPLGETGVTSVEDPKLAVLADGNIATIYVESRNGAYNSFIEINTASGTRVLVPTAVDNIGRAGDPNIVALDDGGFAVAYVQGGNSATGELRLAFYTASGALRGNVPVATISTFTDTDPTLSVLSNGFVDVTWTSGTSPNGARYNDDISAAIFDPASMAKVIDGNLETQDQAQYEPAVTALSNGTFATAWTDDNAALADGNVDSHGSHISVEIDAIVRTSVGTSDSDTLTGDSLQDLFTGGAGGDRFVYSVGGGADTITDFAATGAARDQIVLSGFSNIHSFYDLSTHFVQFGPDAVIDFGNGDTLTLKNVDKATLASTDFAGLVAAPADFNGDAKADLLFLNNTNRGIAEWQMNGTTVTASPQIGTVTTGWHFADVGDFNADHRTDLLFLNDTTHGIAEWQMNGSTVTASPQIGIIAAGWRFSDTGDYNGDGKTDLLFQNDTTHGLAVWQMNGTTVTANPQIGTVTAGWNYVDSGDFNGDHKTDLLFVNDSTHGVAIWQMNGTTVTAKPQIGTVNAAGGWHFQQTGDFNGDGKTDLLFLNDTTRGVAIWQMNGTTVTSNSQIGTITTGWHFQDTGDFNGDGKTDLLFVNDSTHGVAIWQMNGNTVTSSPEIGTVAAGWHYSGLADTNGDHKTDILFANDNTHGIAVWQMDGTHVVANPQIGTVNAAADWHLIT